MTPAVQTFQEHPFVRGLDARSLRLLAEHARTLRFEPGTFILREGDVAGTLYLLRSGQVALEVQVPGKGVMQVESLHSGDILGFSWLFPRASWILDARVVEAVEATALDGAWLLRMMDEDAALGHALSRRLIQHLYARLERVRMQRLDLYRAEP